jgi:hypothetical protein
VVGSIVTSGTGPRRGAVQVDGPSPSPSSLVGEDWGFFSGRWDHSGSSDSWFTSEHEDNGVKFSIGFTGRGSILATDDRRMHGTRTFTSNLFSDADENGYGRLGSSLWTITNDEGAWTCSMTFVHFPTHRNPNGEFEQSAGWCEGSGAYESLKAYLTDREEGVFGFISSGDGPPMPEAAAN